MEYVPKNYIKTTKITSRHRQRQGRRSCNSRRRQLRCSRERRLSSTASRFPKLEARFAANPLSSSFRFPTLSFDSRREPTLTTLELAAGQDIAVAYFGMRSVSINGSAIELNHKPVFQRLCSRPAVLPGRNLHRKGRRNSHPGDIELSKAAGFNGAVCT